MNKILTSIILIITIFILLFPASNINAQTLTKREIAFNNSVSEVENTLIKFRLWVEKSPKKAKECKTYDYVKNTTDSMLLSIKISKEAIKSYNNIQTNVELQILREMWNSNKDNLYSSYEKLIKCSYDLLINDIYEYLNYAGYMSKYIDNLGGNWEAVRTEITIALGELESSKKYYKEWDFWSWYRELGRVKDNIKNISKIIITYR